MEAIVGLMAGSHSRNELVPIRRESVVADRGAAQRRGVSRGRTRSQG
ncbi:hypothetical protein ACP4OV_010708 [Aristida adscensionis]